MSGNRIVLAKVLRVGAGEREHLGINTITIVFKSEGVPGDLPRTFNIPLTFRHSNKSLLAKTLSDFGVAPPDDKLLSSTLLLKSFFNQLLRGRLAILKISPTGKEKWPWDIKEIRPINPNINSKSEVKSHD